MIFLASDVDPYIKNKKQIIAAIRTSIQDVTRQEEAVHLLQLQIARLKELSKKGSFAVSKLRSQASVALRNANSFAWETRASERV